MMALISKIAELKQQQSVIDNLINRVSVLENMPDETKKQLSEYLHDFNVTDQYLGSLNDDQIKFHDDVIKYLKQFNTVLANKQVVVDENVINDIKNLVIAQTGFNLKKYVTNVQQQLITKAFSDLTAMQQRLVKQQQQIIDTQQTIIDKTNAVSKRLDDLDDHVSEYLKDIMIVVCLMGSLAVLLLFPNYVMAFNRHPALTIAAFIIALLTCGFTGYVAFYDNDNRGDDGDN